MKYLSMRGMVLIVTGLGIMAGLLGGCATKPDQPNTTEVTSSSSPTPMPVPVPVPVTQSRTIPLPAREGSAKVIEIHNTVTFSLDGNDWRMLPLGKVLTAGTMLQTANNSHVDLFLTQNCSVLRMTESTKLGLKTLRYGDSGSEVITFTELDLIEGRILANVKKLAANSRYEVITPEEVRLFIKETDFAINADGMVHIFGGVAELQSRAINGGAYSYFIKSGKRFLPATATQPAQEVNIPVSDLYLGSQIIELGRHIIYDGPFSSPPPFRRAF